LARRTATPRPYRRGFLLGLATGAVCFWGTLYWLVETMTTFGELPWPLAVVAASLLVAYLALFPGAFAVLVVRFTRTFGPIGLLLAAPAWVVTELGRQYVWDGFPWALLGYSQVTWLPIAQVASLAGVYGLSALLALTSAAAALVVIDHSRRRWIVGAATALLVVAGTGWGAQRLAASRLTSEGTPVRVGVLQGNIEQEQKWDPRLVDQISTRYLEMTRSALADGATFVLWPESATPYLFERDPVRAGAVRRLAVEAKATLLVGSDQIEPLLMPVKDGVTPRPRYYNAAFLVKPDGMVGAIYRKMHLVPFGEYVPLKRLLFFVDAITGFPDFTPGEAIVLLPVGDHLASTAICYEVIYGNAIRDAVRRGSELLTTITNDAWYGRSSAAYQHWEQASMRAIENGRYLARAANTGISGFVDPYGRVLARSDLFEPRTLIHEVRFLKGRTVYFYVGDLAAWLSLALVAAALLASRAAALRR
ncbi:MAG: apolipoprotein N-acyltransferase, partial [Vicinamibacterales bacterium]